MTDETLKHAMDRIETLAREKEEFRLDAERFKAARPVAWAIFADNGNIRIWTASTLERGRIEDEHGAMTPLYARTKELV